MDAATEAGLSVTGLMAIGRAGGPARGPPGFRLLRRLVDDLGLAECSMGMTDDLEVAVEEGSTMVRVGTAVFGPRPGARSHQQRGTSELTSVEEAAMAFFKKAMNYLGLGPDDAYDEYDLPDGGAAGSGAALVLRAESIDSGTVRTVPAGAAARATPGRRARPASEPEQPSVTVRARTGSAVRTMPAGAAPPRPYTVRPTRFDHAQEVADNFKEGVPVIVNLQDVNKELLRRIIDFCAGLTYGLDGSMDKVGNGHVPPHAGQRVGVAGGPSPHERPRPRGLTWPTARHPAPLRRPRLASRPP